MKELLKSEKMLKIAFIAGIAVIALIFVSGLFGDNASSSTTEETVLEQRISDMLLAMEDISERPDVTVKLDSDKLTVLGVTVVCRETSSNIIREGDQCGIDGACRIRIENMHYYISEVLL